MSIQSYGLQNIVIFGICLFPNLKHSIKNSTSFFFIVVFQRLIFCLLEIIWVCIRKHLQKSCKDFFFSFGMCSCFKTSFSCWFEWASSNALTIIVMALLSVKCSILSFGQGRRSHGQSDIQMDSSHCQRAYSQASMCCNGSCFLDTHARKKEYWTWQVCLSFDLFIRYYSLNLCL